MTPDQVTQLHKLVRATATDQGRAYSATWSLGRLRTMMINESVKRGHQIVDAYVPGSPASIKQMQRPVEATPPDLSVLDKYGRRLLNLDLFVGSHEGRDTSFEHDRIYNAVVRVMTGVIDAFVISADADVYDLLHLGKDASVGKDAKRLKVFEAVLPPPPMLSVRNPRQITMDDSALSVVGTRITAFGKQRAVCACYLTPQPGPMFAKP